MADNPYVAAGVRAGLPTSLANFMPRYVHVESGGNANARTGSYTGLLQMGPDEIAKYGGNDIDAGARMYADKAKWFASKYGRDPTPTELYMINQQGQGGVAAHMANPSGAAWMNMYNTAEGQKKGPGWSKQAIWGNVPDDQKGNYPGGVDSMTSQQFLDLWRNKIDPQGGQPFSPIAAQPAQQPQATAWSPLAASQASGAPSQPGADAGTGGLLGSAVAQLGGPSAAQQQQQGGLFPSLSSMTAGTPLSGMFAQPQQGASQGGGYMLQVPQPQQLQVPQIQYYRPQQAQQQLQLPQLAPFRFS